jgi:arylformamidase
MPRPDPAWLDLQYNNRARVPEHPQILERWTVASEFARAHGSRRIDVAYGATPAETLDVFPTPRANAPVLVFIHGGWWRTLDKSDHSFIAPVFNQAGALVVIPNYALCPAVTIETIALQLTRALIWTHRNAALYGGDPQRIVVAGHSAGGHLAAMLLSCDWRAIDPKLPARLVRGALSISGLFDLEPLRHTPFLKADLRLTPASVQRLSPVRFPRPSGPLYATVGALESEEFLRQNQAIRDAWGAKSVPVCEAVTGTNHFNVLHALADPQNPLHARALQLLGLA